MTMDEVNDRFPLTKYKAWVTTRAEEGLSTEGGVASPRSRPASLKNIDGVFSNNEMTQMPEEGERSTIPSGPSLKSPSSPKPTDSSSPDSPSPDTLEKLKDPVAKETTLSPPTSPIPLTPRQVHDDNDMDDDDQIQIAVPTEMLATPGDSCAICLDTLEDDDDVRGLTCGHAFHASCLDPWLTSRRACCPLCKTDYHVPKPRPEGEAAIDAERHTGRRQAGPSGGRDNLPNSPQYSFTGGRTGASFRPRLIFPGRFLAIGNRDGRENRRIIPVVAQLTRPTSRRPNQATVASPTTDGVPNAETGNPPSWRSRMGAWRPNISLPNRLRRNENTTVTTESNGAPQVGAATTGTSPGQLEAGVR